MLFSIYTKTRNTSMDIKLLNSKPHHP
uniref:Uncharacterized protein n=1 Tax=Arundo donax TaxID=35708 RepID=A0A0A9G1L9_ARUDO